MIDMDNLEQKIREKMKEISLILMSHEKKNSCLAQVHPLSWKHVLYEDNQKEYNFVIIPSPAFDRLIIQQEYLEIVNKFPNLFGTGNDWDVVKAIKEYDKKRLLREYSDQEFFDYIRGETMAYVFKVEDDDTLSERVLRLDLCRNINPDNVFQGGVFHVFKHFTPAGFETISSHHKEFEVETLSDIYICVILNFFSDDFRKEKGHCYEVKSLLGDMYVLRGIYYKEDNIPVSFINSIRIDKQID